ncbi:MAG: putative 3-methyladenine DNA glycosylase [Chlamydiae bacterium]|nr:putative 3-methyladenine DNA glycosylase [Chlamydiota bacterium]
MGTQTQKKKTPLKFYRGGEILQIGRELLGKYLFTCIDGELTGGMIIETESYKGPEDKASHAYGNRKTKRTSVLFEKGGVAYVYLCYGIHHLFNIVTYKAGTPHAILVRAILPTDGIKTMVKRRKKESLSPALTDGPGTVTQALGINTHHTGLSLLSDTIWIEERGITIAPDRVICSPRVGIDYAEEDALLPWRFRLAENSAIT